MLFTVNTKDNHVEEFLWLLHLVAGPKTFYLMWECRAEEG